MSKVNRISRSSLSSEKWCRKSFRFRHFATTLDFSLMGRRGVAVYSRPLVYRTKTIQVAGFGPYTFLSGEEKGIDVRLALPARLPSFKIDGSRLPAPSLTALAPVIGVASMAQTGVQSTSRLMTLASTRAITVPVCEP
jgi:hypothetical protein